MRRFFALTLAVLFFAVPVAYAANGSPSRGPAPNSGDCIPDGSGFEAPIASGGPNGPGTNTNTTAVQNVSEESSGKGDTDRTRDRLRDCVEVDGLDCEFPW